MKASIEFIAPVSPYKKVNGSDVDFTTACVIVDSWTMVKRVKNWENVLGAVFLQKLFEIAPELQQLWGFESGKLHPSVFKEEKARQKGAALLLAVGNAVDLLGPEMEPLEQELFALGRRHIHMKAEAHHWPFVGEALMYTMKRTLRTRFTDYDEAAWREIYAFLSYWMIEGLVAEKRDVWEAEQQMLHSKKHDDDSVQGTHVTGTASVSSRRSSLSSTASGRSYNAASYVPEEIMENIYDKPNLDDIDFGTVQMVMDSWATVTSNPKWLEISSTMVLKKLFQLRPEVKTAWGFADDFDPDALDDSNHQTFVNKGHGFMIGVDRAVGFLGPDLEPLEQSLEDLGRLHHLNMGARVEFFPPVGLSLIYTLEKCLGNRFTEEIRSAWLSIYSFLAYYMIEGLLLEKRGE